MKMDLIKITQSNEASDKSKKKNIPNNRQGFGSTAVDISKQTGKMSTFAQGWLKYVSMFDISSSIHSLF